VSADARGWRVALVPDAFVNAAAGLGATLPDVLHVLQANQYGLLQLPPPGKHSLLLAVIADQVAEYTHHGYAVVAIGMYGEHSDGLHWRRLAPLLRHRGVQPLPPRHRIRANGNIAAQEQELAHFLAGYDLPVEEQRRWRV
jgi:hypothetical protein